jgi:exportin-1
MVIISVIKGCIRIIEQLTDAIEPNENITLLRECVRKALQMMVELSLIPEDELFKICIDFWHFLSTDIMQNPRHAKDASVGAHIGMDFYSVLQGSFMSQHVYPEIFANVEQILVDKMVKPKEVLVVIDDNGDAVEEVIDDTETIQVYETMRETLVYLTNIDKIGVERVI